MVERILPPEMSQYIGMKSQEVLSTAREASKHYAENSPNDKKFAQELVGDTVNALTRANELGNEDVAKEILETARDYIEIRMPYEDWKVYKAGILAETSVRISLKSEGFGIKEPSSEEDRNCIDLWIDPLEGKPIWAAQIKARTVLEEPVVSRSRFNNEGSYEDEIVAKYPELYDEETEILARISSYLEDSKFSEMDIEPIVIWVPSGDRTRELMSAYKSNGEPGPGFSAQLYGKISRSFEWENDNE